MHLKDCLLRQWEERDWDAVHSSLACSPKICYTLPNKGNTRRHLSELVVDTEVSLLPTHHHSLNVQSLKKMSPKCLMSHMSHVLCLMSHVSYVPTIFSISPVTIVTSHNRYPYPNDLVIAIKGGLLRIGPYQWPQHLDETLSQVNFSQPQMAFLNHLSIN